MKSQLYVCNGDTNRSRMAAMGSDIVHTLRDSCEGARRRYFSMYGAGRVVGVTVVKTATKNINDLSGVRISVAGI